MLIVRCLLNEMCPVLTTSCRPLSYALRYYLFSMMWATKCHCHCLDYYHLDPYLLVCMLGSAGSRCVAYHLSAVQTPSLLPHHTAIPLSVTYGSLLVAPLAERLPTLFALGRWAVAVLLFVVCLFLVLDFLSSVHFAAVLLSFVRCSQSASSSSFQ